jgi:site-specific recombinase
MQAILKRFTEADADAVVLLEQLLAEMRPARRGDAAQASASVARLCALLTEYPACRAALRAHLRRLLGGAGAAALYADTGILGNTGFFTELWRRMVGRVLPPPRDATPKGVFGQLFDSGDDADWITSVEPGTWRVFVAALRFDEDAPAAWHAAWINVLDALDILAVRVAATGVETDLARHYHVPPGERSPFFTQLLELRDWSDGVRAALERGDSAPLDEKHLLVLLDQCRQAIDAVRRSAHRNGTSLRLTFTLRRTEQLVRRMAVLIDLVAGQLAGRREPAIERRIALALELVDGERGEHDVGAHLRANTDLLALQVTENASRTGEHYITESRAGYYAMFRSALGAGFIVACMALVKVNLSAAELPPLIEGIAFSLNYALGFMLIYVLHFTLATKQPAMTASTIAASLQGAGGRRIDFDALSRLIASVSRTQLVAVAGNVLLALPVGFMLTGLLGLADASPLNAAKGELLVEELHPWLSPALFHASIAGVWLFLSGLIAGYYDNLAVHERLRERVLRIRWLQRLLGEARLVRFARWLEGNLGGLAGNFFFGFMLGMTPFIGAILGLPLDIRHVTFAAANLALVLGDPALRMALEPLLWSVAGIFLIGCANLAVSFSLALFVAMRARGLNFNRGEDLARSLWQHFRRAPLSFFYPPRER